jgi:hypothetical protein
MHRSSVDVACWLSSLAYASRFKRVGRDYFFDALFALVDVEGGAQVVQFAADRMPSHVGHVEPMKGG